MATKVDKAPKAPVPKKGAGADDLATLHPERVIEIRGRRVVAREYGFVEGLELTATTKPFLDDLYALIAQDRTAPAFDAVLGVVAQHVELTRRLVAQSVTPFRDDPRTFGEDIAATIAWINTLSDEEGDLLFLAWWGANAGFFIRRVLRLAAAQKVAASPLSGAASTQTSSAPATDAAPPTSAG